MKAALVIAHILVLVLLSSAAHAGGGLRDVDTGPPVVYVPGNPLQNPNARAVMVLRECWRTCERSCATLLFQCGYRAPGAQCLPQADTCDRACQRQCRTSGAPALGLFD